MVDHPKVKLSLISYLQHYIQTSYLVVKADSSVDSVERNNSGVDVNRILTMNANVVYVWGVTFSISLNSG